MVRLGSVAVVLAVLAAPALASPAARKGSPGGYLQLGTGYRGIFPFDEEFCGETDPDKSYCIGRRPLALDLGGFYGVTENLDLMLSFLIGLEADFGATSGQDGPHPFALVPGAKLRLTDLGPGWLTATLELPIDFSSYDQADSVDLGVRNRNAFEIPLTPNLAASVFFGETASWRRWFRFEIDFGLGVVVRR